MSYFKNWSKDIRFRQIPKFLYAPTWLLATLLVLVKSMDKENPEYKKHKMFASNHTFAFGEALNDFTPSEKALLHKNGYWLNALAAGLILPITDAQKRFLEVCAGNKNAITNHEVVWLKYLAYQKGMQVSIEKRNQENREFGRKIENLSNDELRHLLIKDLTQIQRAYAENEWRHRFPPAGGVIHANTDGQ